MKKSVFILLVAVFLIQFSSAKFICPNGEAVIEDQNEIDIKSSRIINGLGIGVIEADEVSVSRKFDATLLVDSAKLLISNKTSPQKIELLTKSYTIALINTSSTTAKITVEGNSKELEEDTSIEISGLTVFLAGTDSSETDIPNAKLVIGVKQIILSNYDKQYEKIEVANNTFFITLYSSSDSNAIVIVSKCEKSHITEVAEKPEVNETQTNTTVKNETQVNNTKTETKNETTQNSTQTENKTTEIPSTFIEESKPGFFKKFFSWLKRFFGGE